MSISNINVRVGPGAPSQIQSTAQFFGASDQIAEIQRISDLANNAAETANTALSQVGAAFLKANSAYASQNTTGVYANSAFSSQNTTGVYANSAYSSQNTTGIYANSAYSSQNTTGVYANSAFTAANTASSDALAYAIALG